MTREEFIKQRCEIDKITEEEFERTYRVVECNCGKIYCKGYRCLDLDGLSKENKELKKKYENAVADYETTMAEKNELEQQCRKQKEAIDKAIQLLEDDNICADIRRIKPKWNENKYGVEYELLDILKEVSK